MGVRDFAVLCSARFQEITSQVGPVRVHSFAFPEHEFYSRQMLRIIAEALPVFQRWFGPFPYPDFTIVESYFGWNGNQCGDLVMIDARIFGMPHHALQLRRSACLARALPPMVVQRCRRQRLCRDLDGRGAGRLLLAPPAETASTARTTRSSRCPDGLEWLPNIHREDYRYTHDDRVAGPRRGHRRPSKRCRNSKTSSA